ncbi:hypothetical protein ACQ4PT_006314 [Festuca glaucescens]
MKYETYMRGIRVEEELPGVGLKRLKKMLKKCRSEPSSHHETAASSSAAGSVRCAGHCSVCDGSFFPSLLGEMSAVVGCFNEKAKKLLELHLASGFKKYAMWFTNRCHKGHGQLIQQGKDLVTYAIINAVAMRKILKKYDKAGVFPNAVRLDELNVLLSYSCPEYWEKRTQLERVESVRLAKERWESQCRAFLGI